MWKSRWKGRSRLTIEAKRKEIKGLGRKMLKLEEKDVIMSSVKEEKEGEERGRT